MEILAEIVKVEEEVDQQRKAIQKYKNRLGMMDPPPRPSQTTPRRPASVDDRETEECKKGKEECECGEIKSVCERD